MSDDDGNRDDDDERTKTGADGEEEEEEENLEVSDEDDGGNEPEDDSDAALEKILRSSDSAVVAGMEKTMRETVRDTIAKRDEMIQNQLEELRELKNKAADTERELIEARKAVAKTKRELAKEDEPIEMMWWELHPNFPTEFKNLPPSTYNPKINEEKSDDEEMARVRRETKIFLGSLVSGGWFHPGQIEGAFHKVPSEVLMKLLHFARSDPHKLPWNPADLDRKVTFLMFP
jgi:hypothetical protein